MAKGGRLGEAFDFDAWKRRNRLKVFQSQENRVINVETKQKHIGNVAKRDPSHRFTGLYRTLCNETWLTAAWMRIRGNKGSRSPGIDGQTRNDVDDSLIQRLAEKLRKEEYSPKPVRRVHIPKANGKLRPLGIPTIQDRIAQSALKMILEPIYEQVFDNCSHGFRPKRSCITALRDVAHRFPRTTWIIEGDIKGCFDNIHHGRLMSILRQRINDEKLLRLVYSFLRAGYLEQWTLHRTYSGTPQGGIVSPLLANIYLHELDKFMKDTLKANPMESKKEQNARRTPESRRLENRITRLKTKVKRMESVAPREERDAIIREIRELEKERKGTPSLKTRQLIGYTRYADDYLITLQQHSKIEAKGVKEQIKGYLKTHLRLEQSEEKTSITHPTDGVKFLGYILTSKGGRRKGLRLEIPKRAKDKLLDEVKRLCDLHHIDEVDLFLKVNAAVRGWMNYYKYAKAPQGTFSATLARIWWVVAHYLAGKHATTIPKIIRTYSQTVTQNGRRRKTLRKWIGNKAIDLWRVPPKTESIYGIGIDQPEIDAREWTVHEWASGRSIGNRISTLEEASYQCEECGTTENLKVHHIGGLRGYRNATNRAIAGKAKNRKVLCENCHKEIGHGGSYAPRNRSRKDSLTGKPDAPKEARPVWEGAS